MVDMPLSGNSVNHRSWLFQKISRSDALQHRLIRWVVLFTLLFHCPAERMNGIPHSWSFPGRIQDGRNFLYFEGWISKHVFPNWLKHCPRVRKDERIRSTINTFLHYSSINQCSYEQWELMGVLLVILFSLGFPS